MKATKFSLNMIGMALVVLSIGLFSSITFSSLSHILFFIGGMYLFIKYKFYYNLKEIYLEKKNTSVFYLILFSMIAIISVMYNYEIDVKPIKNILKTKYLLLSILSIYPLALLYKHSSEKKIFKISLNLLIGMATIASICGLIGYFTGMTPLKFKPACHASRNCGFYGMYMSYGYGISLFLTLLFGMALYKRKIRDWTHFLFIYICLVINTIGLAFSFTRGGWIGFIISVPFFFLKKSKKIFIFCWFIILLSTTGLLLQDGRFKKTFSERGKSDTQRISFYQAALYTFKENPILGVGYRNFEFKVKEIKTKYNLPYPNHVSHAHNNFLEIMASTGILGLITFSFFLFFWLKEMYVRNDIVAQLTFPFIINFLVSGLFQYTFGDGINMFLIMIVFTISQLKYAEISITDQRMVHV